MFLRDETVSGPSPDATNSVIETTALFLPSNGDSAISIQRGAVSVVCNHHLLSAFKVWLIAVYQI
jgi:hypothetical protein